MHYIPQNRTFWNYSGIGLALLTLLIANLTFAPAIGMVMSKYYDMSFTQFIDAVGGNMGSQYTNLARLFNFLSFLAFMLFPSLLVLTLNRTRIQDVLKHRNPGLKQIGISILLILCALPLGMYLAFLIEGLQWPDAIRSIANNLNATRQTQFELLLQMKGLGELFICLGLLAVLPAFCEELLFRGLIQPILMTKMNKVWLPIILQATLFSLLHFSFYEFFTIFGLGIILGLIAYRYGLLMSMLAHFTFNSITIVAEYMAQQGFSEAENF